MTGNATDRRVRLHRQMKRAFAALATLGMLSAPVLPAERESASPQVEFQLASATVLDAPDIDLLKGTNALIVDRGDAAKEGNRLIPLSDSPLVGMRAFTSIGTDSPQYSSAHQCMAQAIYYEAATEPLQGQRAVAQVVLNRVRHPAYPSSVCDVVYQGWNAPVCQFSFVCDGSLLRRPSGGYWERAQRAAEAALSGFVEDSVGSATHYHADYVLPRWAYRLGKITQIGRHIFYRLPGGAGEARNFRSAWRGSERIPQIDFRRFDGSLADADLDAEPPVEAFAALLPDPTDRRAPNDVGGRLDTSTSWRLEIPDPTEASSGYRQAVANHGPSQDDEQQ